MKILDKIEEGLNPIFVLEMRQLARQKKFMGLLVAYALILAYFCYAAIPSHFSSLISRKDEAEEIMMSLLVLSFVVNSILVPIFLSDHFIKSGSSKQLYLIFTSPIRSVEISRGKLYVGLSVLCTSILMTIPIWCLLSFTDIISFARALLFIVTTFSVSLVPLTAVLLISSFGFSEFVRKVWVLAFFLFGFIFSPFIGSILFLSENELMNCFSTSFLALAVSTLMHSMSETEPSRLR